MLSPWSLHPYQYVNQNPVMYWDPDGKDWMDWVAGACGVVTGALDAVTFDRYSKWTFGEERMAEYHEMGHFDVGYKGAKAGATVAMFVSGVGAVNAGLQGARLVVAGSNVAKLVVAVDGVRVATGVGITAWGSANLAHSLRTRDQGGPAKSGQRPGATPRDVPTKSTNQWSATFKSEGKARALAKSKLGKSAREVEPNKFRSADGKWQYRAKPGDVQEQHVHLEELDPQTGAVKQNLHLRWPEEGGRLHCFAARETYDEARPGHCRYRDARRTRRLYHCDVANSPPGPVALGLALLHEELIDKLSLRPSTGRWTLRLHRSGRACDSRLSRYGEQRLELALSQLELERWLVFFLKYHRDGQAEVDHLDVETTWTTGVPCDLVLKVSQFAAPVSADEARRRLGLEET